MNVTHEQNKPSQICVNSCRILVQRPPNSVKEILVMLSHLLEAHELIIEKLRVAINKTAVNQDGGANDLLVALQTNEKQVWFFDRTFSRYTAGTQLALIIQKFLSTGAIP
jgi:DNA-binding ferritin-like protein